MTTRFFSFRGLAPHVTVVLALLSGCSGGTHLFDDGVSFAGSTSAGAAAGGAESAGGRETTPGGAAPGGAASSGAAGDADGGESEPPASAGAGGMPEPTPCVATGAEACNAVDDDCNGVVDEGCPAGISTTFAKDLPLLGDSPGGSAFTDDCGDGEVLAGVGVTMGAFLSQIHGLCRPLSLELSDNAEHGYRVALGALHTLAPHPGASPDWPTRLMCPNDDALVGIRLAQQYYTPSDGTILAVTSRIWLTCAKLVLNEHGEELSVTWEGAKELAPASGSIANGTAWFASSTAPEGLVGSRLLGTSGTWIDRVGFGVSQLKVVRK
ncbi:MAG TPA: hypothetical protein VHP33_25800 [Polyangiaceae bacterium]|nr:hypothetical protein [Polyangiaceae bacterium]